MPLVELDGCELFYGTGGVEWREGGPLAVLIHGAGNDHSVWALQARTLAQQGWNIAAIDLPGHGRSQDRDDVATIEGYAEVVGAGVARLAEEGRPFALVGHSMGSCIALTLAAKMSDRESLSLVLVGAGKALPVNEGLLDATLHRPFEAHRFITAFGYGRPSHFGGSESPGVWNLGASFALLERCEPEVLHRDFAACNAWRGDDLGSRVTARALVVSGQLDRMTPARAGRALAESIARAQFSVLPGLGHMMMAESPSAVSDLLVQFLGSEEVSNVTC